MGEAPKNQPFQFSLRTIFAIVTVAATWIAINRLISGTDETSTLFEIVQVGATMTVALLTSTISVTFAAT